MKKNLAAIVVLYHPEKSFIKNILSYINEVGLLVVVDNTPQPDLNYKNELAAYSNIEFLNKFENTGIAGAVNAGMSVTSARGYKWVLVMDQDSCFAEDMITQYLSKFASTENLDTVAVAGPLPSMDVKGKSSGIIDVISVITSGSILNSPIFIETGGYNEDLFIDEVDHEYCYRAKSKGYRILQFTDIILQHSLGVQAGVTTLTGRQKIKTFHSPTRLYYIVRNCCYVIKKYKHVFPEEMRLKRRDLLVRIKNHLLYGNEKLRSFGHILKGYAHYKKNHFGKLK